MTSTPSRRAPRLTLAFATALALASGCAEHGEHGGALEPTLGDLVPEVALSGDALRSEWIPDGDFLRSPILDAPTGATRAGVMMDLTSADAEAPLMEARGLDAAGAPGEWVPLEVTWREDAMLVARADLGLDAFAAELRVADADRIAGVVWSAVVPANDAPVEAPTLDEGGRVGSTSSALRSDLAAVGVVSRSAWGARSTSCSSNTSKNRMAIHHTVTPATSDPAVRVRGIQAFHIDTRGWCDIGYHFLVSLDGRMWEGRPLGQLGTHVGGHNTGNIGISFIGCFQNSGCNDWTPFTPPSVMLDGGATLVREMSRIHGIAINSTNVKGHRDHSGATTSCPGDNLHALLPEIRSRASGPTGPVWSAEYVNQTFPLAANPFVIPPGEERSGYIELRNTGTDSWRPGETFLGTTEPRDGASPIEGSDWVSASRAATIDRVVAPGESGRFEFSVRAPTTAGEYPQYFNLVQEGVAWFSAPGDDQLQIRVTVDMDAPDPPDPVDMGTPPVTADAGMPTEGDAGAPVPPLGDMAVVDTTDGGVRIDPGSGDDGCGCRIAGASSSDDRTPVGFPAALLLGTVLVWRRFARRGYRLPSQRG